MKQLTGYDNGHVICRAICHAISHVDHRQPHDQLIKTPSHAQGTSILILPYQFY